MNLLILGAGEYGQLVKELARNMFVIIDFLDDNSPSAVGKLKDYKSLKDKYKNAIVAIGNNQVRSEWIEKLEKSGYNLPIIISDRAHISLTATIGPGCIVEPMAIIQSNVKVGKGSIISSGAVVNHNAIVHNCCHIDCNAVVGADAIVPEKMNLSYGQVITRATKIKNMEFNE